jgi:hypothetical protein
VPARSHKPFHVGSNPTSATHFGRSCVESDCQPSTQIRQSGQVESLVIDCGFDSRLGYWCRRAETGRRERQARPPRRLSPGRRHSSRASVGDRMCQGGEAASHAACVGFDSHRLHCNRASGPTGRCQPGALEMRVRFPRGPLLTPMVKTEIIPRYERGVPGSSPGRGIATVPWPGGRASL